MTKIYNTEDRRLLISQLFKICSENEYIAARFSNNEVVGINCKIANLSRFNHKRAQNKESRIISCKPINFQQYISIKKPFL